jgi:hypothetical protein
MDEEVYPIIGELKAFLNEMGWVVRYESCGASDRGLFGEDATSVAIPMIAGFMYAKTMDEIAKRKEGEDDDDGQGAT